MVVLKGATTTLLITEGKQYLQQVTITGFFVLGLKQRSLVFVVDPLNNFHCLRKILLIDFFSCCSGFLE